MTNSTPNLTKLVSWDIDYLATLSDDECLICISQKDMYILGQALQQVRWQTRWWSEQQTPPPNIDDIADRLEALMSTDSCVDICQLVADCIETNTDIQQLISTYSNTSNINSTTPQQVDILAQNLLAGVDPACNKDNLFGASTQLVDLLNRIAEDVLEIFVGAFAVPSRFSDIISAIPVVETLPADEALEFAEKMAVQINNGYQSAYDTQLRDEFRCDIFCLMQENCELTMETIRNYFKDKITVPVTGSDFVTLANDIIANNWIGQATVYATHWFILDTYIFGGEILGIDTNKLANQIAIFFNDPDSDWNILCDSCYPTIDVTFDTLIDPLYEVTWSQVATTQIAQPDLQSTAQGNPTPSAYLGYGDFSGSKGSGARVWVELTTPQPATQMSMEHYAINFTGGPTYRYQTLFDDQMNVLASVAESVPHASGTWKTMTNNVNVQDVTWIRSYAGFATSGGGATSANMQSYIDNIKLIP